MKRILIHGLGQNSIVWNKTISDMVEQDNILCLELSKLLEGQDVTYQNLYNSFSNYCNNIPETLDLCGLSLGAVLALNYAIDNPNKVNSLVLIAAQYEMPKILLELQNIIFRFIPNKYFKGMGMSRGDFIKLTKSMMNLNLKKGLNNILCRVLLVCGENDNPNKKATIDLNKCILKSEMIFIKNSKHEVNNDNPKELAKVLNEFYKS